MEDLLKNQIEALLFACGRKISLDEIMKMTGISHTDVIKEKLTLLQQEYGVRDSPLMLVEEPEGWKLTTREKYLPLVQKIVPHTELSKTVLETLAVVAWKQPMLQSDVIRIRTNKAYEHIAELEKMGFLSKQKYGRTYSISLTQKFYDYFDLKDAEAAKTLFKDIKEGEVSLQKPLPAESIPQPSTQQEQEPPKEEVPEDEKEEDVYASKDELLEEDEITPDEEKFMEGYEQAAPDLKKKKNNPDEKDHESTHS